MTNSSFRHLWPGCAVALAALHIGMTAMYLLPSSIVRNAARPLWTPYMSTLFHQNWHLFSPDPALSSTKLAVQCRWADDASSEWIDPAEQVLSSSYGFRRLLGYGKLLYIIRDIPRALQRAMVTAHERCNAERGTEVTSGLIPAEGECAFPALVAEVTREGAGAAARDFAVGICRAIEHDAELATVDIKVIDFMPLKYSERDRFASEGVRWSRVSETIYPSIVIAAPQDQP
jgi:hypothetical protein